MSQAGAIFVDNKILNRENNKLAFSDIACPSRYFSFRWHNKRKYCTQLSSSEIDFNQVKECASVASILNYIETLPNGFDTKVGERGIKLRRQIQRIGIARALYKKSSILLDEATSALDNSTEKLVLKAIQKNEVSYLDNDCP